MSDVSFLATIYRNITFDKDGGGKVTLLFDAQQEVAVLRLLTMRHHVLTVSLAPVEGYGDLTGKER